MRFPDSISNRGAPLLATIVLTAVATILVTWPLARELGTSLLPMSDVRLNAWQLNWLHQALLTDPPAWVDANIYFPYDNTGTLNDLLLTHALVTLPVAWAASPVLALNLALLGGIVLCGVFAHLLIVELTDAPWAATVGATLFALAPFRFLHLGHLSIAAAWAVPLFFWALLRHLRLPSGGRAALVAIAGVAVGASSVYHAAYTAPIIPLVLLLGARRGPGGLKVWLPMVVAAVPGLVLLGSLLVPYATALGSFGMAAAPSDLGRYGADLSSLAQKPYFMSGAGGAPGISGEARLYPGIGLALLAAAGMIYAAWSVWTLRGWRRHSALVFLAFAGAAGLGFVVSPEGVLGDAWTFTVLTVIWAGPVLGMVWAIQGTDSRDATGPAVAIRLGLAGALLSFMLALGPHARYMTEVIGPAPYWLLVQASQAFEGTRAPARFGGLVILFLALVAAGVLAAIARGSGIRRRLAAASVAVLALAACFHELPAPALPEGRPLAPVPELSDPAYAWIRGQPGRFGILELPEWRRGEKVHHRHRRWRATRYMLASKQHGQHLVNGAARIKPFLWRRFRRLEPWGDEFFAFITAYLPVRYVLVHEGGLPAHWRDALATRLENGADGWEEVFRSPDVRVYTIDRSFGRGNFIDRLYMHREIGPRTNVAFSARVAPDDELPPGEPRSATLELLRNGEVVEAWTLGVAWRELEVTLPPNAKAPANEVHWPPSCLRLTWRARGEAAPAFEIRDLSVVPKRE